MLTKSDLQAFLQCPRKLWLEHHPPGPAISDDSSGRRRQFDGNTAGAQARAELPDPLWPAGGEDKLQAALDAKAGLDMAPRRSAVEIPMAHGGLYARADALVWTAEGYVLRETKASTFPLNADKVTPAKPDEHHLADIAIQAWTLIESGIQMSRAELNLLDNQWRYPGGDDYAGLFRRLDVTEAIQPLIAQTPSWLAAAEAVLSGGMPEALRGKQCGAPYPCPFHDYCGTLEPAGEAHPLDLLPDSAGKALARRLRDQGHVSLLEPDPEALVGAQSALYQRIQRAHRLGEAVLEPGSVEAIAALAYPRYFFDFEGIDLPVPRWSGVRPFEQIPFQWSCHIERAPGVFAHAEFLNLSGEDPSEACIEAMLAAIDATDGGPILVYSETYERGVLKGLAARHPQHAAALEAYIDRLVDLLPLVKTHFYDPRMRGSFSIKKVLPAVAPDLDYGALDGVQEGTGAQLAYIAAALDPGVSEADKAGLDAQLKTYCRQDTWAMVELAYFLARAGRPVRPPGM